MFMSFSVDTTVSYLNMEKTLSYNYNYNNKTIQEVYGLMDHLFDPR